VLAVNPRFSPALNNLAYLYSEHLNELDRAFEMAQRARGLLPWDPYAADTLGWILFKRQEFAWALSLLQESADKLTYLPEVIYHLGMAQYMMGYDTAARASFERALQLKPDFVGRDMCVRRLAVLALDVRGIDQQTLPMLEEQLSSHTDDPVALTKLAAAYERTGAYHKARQTYERALALNPKNASTTIRLAALHLEHLNDRVTALELGRKARALAPDEPGIAHALGRIAFHVPSASESLWAHSLLQESVRKLPEDPMVRYDLAWSWFALGQLGDATREMRVALDSKIAFPYADDARLFLSFVAGTPTDLEIQAALQQQPLNMPAVAAAGAMHERRGQLVLARKAYETLLDRFPLFVPAHKRLAVIYEAEGNLARAGEHAIAARERAANDPETAKILGIVTFKRGEFARSAQLLRESVRQGYSDAELFYYLGMAHYRLKQLPESRDALRRSVMLNVSPPLAAEANRLLAEMN
jgi:tetratricopeptide (TPR) repeat protein